MGQPQHKIGDYVEDEGLVVGVLESREDGDATVVSYLIADLTPFAQVRTLVERAPEPAPEATPEPSQTATQDGQQPIQS